MYYTIFRRNEFDADGVSLYVLLNDHYVCIYIDKMNIGMTESLRILSLNVGRGWFHDCRHENIDDIRNYLEKMVLAACVY